MAGALVNVVVPARNEARHIGACLASLRGQVADFEYDITVVDNGSTDGTGALAAAAGAMVLATDAATPAAVRNLGAARATGEVLAFLDGDCTAAADWLAGAVVFLREHPAAIAVGGPCTAPADANWVVRCWVRPPAGVGTPARGVRLAGANLVVRRGHFVALGGFDTALTTAEDDDLSRRLAARGEVWADPRLAVVHHGYPDRLGAVLAKARWHGSSQLRAHGLRGDRVVLLTLAWPVAWLVAAIAVAAARPIVALIATGLLLLPPFALAWARLRRARGVDRWRYLAPATLVAAVALTGRLLGMLREVWRGRSGG